MSPNSIVLPTSKKPRIKANKNRKGKERKVRCNACGYAKIRETPSFLHENLLCVGYGNKSDFQELPIGRQVRCSAGSIGLQHGKHFFHDGVYHYYRAPFATVTCLYKRTFLEKIQTRRIKVTKCGFAVVKESLKWLHSHWVGAFVPGGFMRVTLSKFLVLDYEGKPSCSKWPDYGLRPGQFGPAGPPTYKRRHQRGTKKGDMAFDVKQHFYHPNSNRYYIYLGVDLAGETLELTYQKKLEGPVINADWEAVKQEFFDLIGENNPDKFILR